MLFYKKNIWWREYMSAARQTSQNAVVTKIVRRYKTFRTSLSSCWWKHQNSAKIKQEKINQKTATSARLAQTKKVPLKPAEYFSASWVPTVANYYLYRLTNGVLNSNLLLGVVRRTRPCTRITDQRDKIIYIFARITSILVDCSLFLRFSIFSSHTFMYLCSVIKIRENILIVMWCVIVSLNKCVDYCVQKTSL